MSLLAVLPLHSTAKEPEASKDKPCMVIGQVKDYLTHILIDGAKVTLLTKDGVPVDSGRTSKNQTSKVHGRGSSGIRYAEDALLKRKPKTVNLKGVEVKATKIKFYHKGDTLVYNADAFQLSQGSMLDGLIRQMPGVELKDDGRIYVNGKYVGP